MKIREQMSKGKKKFVWTATASVLIVASCLFSSKPGYAQMDLGAVIAMLEQVQGTISSSIMPVMTALNTVNKSMAQFQQTVMYPMSEIQRIKSTASTMTNSMTSMQNLFNSPNNSATLSSTKTLETQVLSGNANNIGSVSTSYNSVYGSLPSSTSMASSVRNATDANDTQAQDAYKKAIQLDSIAKTEETLSKQYMQQLQSMSPGNASLVEAHAAAWNLQAAAYSQQALAELLRTQAVETAYESFQMKQGSTNHQQMMKTLGITSSKN